MQKLQQYGKKMIVEVEEMLHGINDRVEFRSLHQQTILPNSELQENPSPNNDEGLVVFVENPPTNVIVESLEEPESTKDLSINAEEISMQSMGTTSADVQIWKGTKVVHDIIAEDFENSIVHHDEDNRISLLKSALLDPLNSYPEAFSAILIIVILAGFFLKRTNSRRNSDVFKANARVAKYSIGEIKETIGTRQISHMLQKNSLLFCGSLKEIATCVVNRQIEDSGSPVTDTDLAHNDEVLSIFEGTVLAVEQEIRQCEKHPEGKIYLAECGKNFCGDFLEIVNAKHNLNRRFFDLLELVRKEMEKNIESDEV